MQPKRERTCMKSMVDDWKVQGGWSASSISKRQLGGVHCARWLELSARAPRRKNLTLNGREVGANDLGFGVFIGEINGPCASAGADVEDLVHMFGQWSQK